MIEWPSDLDYELAVKCAKLSHNAYYDLPINTTILPEPIAFIDKKCWVHYDPPSRILYIAFRGTDSLPDLCNNFKFIHKEFEGFGKTHSGYHEYYISVQDTLRQLTQKLLTCIDHIVITGHSLGGASAVLASADLSKFHNKITCITFGTPPIADKAFVDAHYERVPKTFRVINIEDWAPKIPIPGLHHVGRPVKLCKNVEAPYEERISPPTPPQRLINSHGMSRYVHCIQHQSCVRSFQPRLAIK